MTWCASKTPEAHEHTLLKTFAERVPDAEKSLLHDQNLVLPFANKELEKGLTKNHGIRGSTLG